MQRDEISALIIATIMTLMAIAGLFLWAKSIDLGMSVFGFGLLVFGVFFDFWLIKHHFDRATVPVRENHQ
ncbi:MAG TPA: hypothetical protein VJR58_10555 [Vineibacter sp.]|nr:hypothetical protein [Vineibacter sp.]